MHLLLQLLERTQLTTISNLFIDVVWECFVLEDAVREEPGVPVEEWKVPGVTAIPAGTYKIDITPSNRFKRLLPILLGVPGFSGSRIHIGNFDGDTEGCLLPGKSHGSNKVGNSKDAFDALFRKLTAAKAEGEPITIEVTR